MGIEGAHIYLQLANPTSASRGCPSPSDAGPSVKAEERSGRSEVEAEGQGGGPSGATGVDCGEGAQRGLTQ